MMIQAIHINRLFILSLISVMAALAFNNTALARDAYLSSALQQKIPGITSCNSCHSSGSARWTGISTAFNSGGLMAVSKCLANNTCGPNANGGTISSALSSKLINGSIGSTTSNSDATSAYKIACPKKTVKLAVSINDQTLAPDGIVTIQAVKKFSSSITSDPVGGDDVYGPVAELKRGPGVYTILVSKLFSTTPGADVFSAQLECIGKPKPIPHDDEGESEGEGDD